MSHLDLLHLCLSESHPRLAVQGQDVGHRWIRLATQRRLWLCKSACTGRDDHKVSLPAAAAAAANTFSRVLADRRRVPVTQRYINYALYRIRMLQYHGITPYVVFDGDRLPSKGGTEEDREARRAVSRAKAEELSAQGKEAAAFEHYAKCVDITPAMAFQLIKALKAQGVQYVVAPYEADAQLAYLERNGLIDAVVTEDSDLLVFGCKKVLFKMDANGGCIEIDQARFTACRTLSFAGWTTDLFRQMAILSGCDYLPSIQGMGLKNAHKLLQRYKTVSKALQAVRLEGRMRVPVDYHKQFEQAEKTFLHQRVWDPRNHCLTNLQPLEGSDVDSDLVTHYVGPHIEHSVALAIAIGEVDPITRKPIRDTMPPCSSSVKAKSAARQPAAQQVAVKGQQKLGRFLTKSQTASGATSLHPPITERVPLAVRDMNKSKSSDQVEAGPQRSKYFGGQSKGINKAASAGVIDVLEHTNADVPAVTSWASVSPDQTPAASLESPSRGMGDYFCELDGADERLLVDSDDMDTSGMDKDDTFEAVKAFAVSRGIAACFDDDEAELQGRRSWPQGRKSISSDMSEGASTPEKSKCVFDSAFSSPLTFDDDDERRCDGVESDHGSPGKKGSKPLVKKSPDQTASKQHPLDAISSPTSVDGSPPRLPSQQREISPVSPLHSKRTAMEEEGNSTSATKRKRENPPGDLQGDSENDSPKAEKKRATGLFDRYALPNSQTPNRQQHRGPLNQVPTPNSRPTLRAWATTPVESSKTLVRNITPSSSRPLRLYKAEQESVKKPFELRTENEGLATSAAPPSAVSTPGTRRSVSNASHTKTLSTLAFASQPRLQKAPSLQSTTTPLIRRNTTPSKSHSTPVLPLRMGSRRQEDSPSAARTADNSLSFQGQRTSSRALDSFRFRPNRS